MGVSEGRWAETTEAAPARTRVEKRILKVGSNGFLVKLVYFPNLLVYVYGKRGKTGETRGSGAKSRGSRLIKLGSRTWENEGSQGEEQEGGRGGVSGIETCQRLAGGTWLPCSEQ